MDAVFVFIQGNDGFIVAEGVYKGGDGVFHRCSPLNDGTFKWRTHEADFKDVLEYLKKAHGKNTLGKIVSVNNDADVERICLMKPEDISKL